MITFRVVLNRRRPHKDALNRQSFAMHWTGPRGPRAQHFFAELEPYLAKMAAEGNAYSIHADEGW
jgi:hypothetical protein